MTRQKEQQRRNKATEKREARRARRKGRTPDPETSGASEPVEERPEA